MENNEKAYYEKVDIDNELKNCGSSLLLFHPTANSIL